MSPSTSLYNILTLYHLSSDALDDIFDHIDAQTVSINDIEQRLFQQVPYDDSASDSSPDVDIA